VQRQLDKLGASADTTAGYLGFAFLFFALAISLFCCFQLSALREEEAEQRPETVLALPIGRHRWLADRLIVAAGGASALALGSGVLGWAGAALAGRRRLGPAHARGGRQTACLRRPSSSALGALAFALVPRAAPGVAYALVGVSFLSETLGALLEAPDWLVGLSPFHYVGLVPAESFQATVAVAMLAIAAAAALGVALAFRRRDLAGT
jgi:ABC-2 type transport system permease protein